jgi:hypothetical protein
MFWATTCFFILSLLRYGGIGREVSSTFTLLEDGLSSTILIFSVLNSLVPYGPNSSEFTSSTFR